MISNFPKITVIELRYTLCGVYKINIQIFPQGYKKEALDNI